MKPLLLTGALMSAAILGALAGGGVVRYQDAHAEPAFDYESCTVIAAKGTLDTAPLTPDWSEMVTTPGGNWCIREKRR